MLNQCSFIGRLGKDPADRTTSSGRQVVQFSVAVSKKVKGEEKTQWINCTSWNENLNKFILQYGRKGDMVYVQGELATRKYEKDGVEKLAVDIVLGYEGKFNKLNWDKKPDNNDGYGDQGGGFGDLDDEIPF